MNNASMTARVSLFARAYHTEREGGAVFADPAAMALLGREEYGQIAEAMARGISFFCPGFKGTTEEALAHIVHRQLAPSPLGRAAFAEGALEEAVGEEMRLQCTPEDMETLLRDCGFAVCRVLAPEEITQTCFAAFNRTHGGCPMEAFPGVHYCLARVIQVE